MNDIKELIGTLMRVVDGAEISEDDLSNLHFEADDELMVVLNAAYIQLLEFVHDRDLRLADRNVDAEKREALQESLNKIVELCGGTS
jgi:predicted transcriptional regulator